MIVDTEPCPLCKASPGPGRAVFGMAGAESTMISHRVEALATMLPDGAMKQELWFICERCGARWPMDDERGRDVDAWS